MNLSTVQHDILNLIAGGSENGGDIDLDEILRRAKHHPSKQGIQFSIRALIKHGLIEKVRYEKRNGARRVIFGVTPLYAHRKEWGFGVVGARGPAQSRVRNE
jgi:hypothetical protein